MEKDKQLKEENIVLDTSGGEMPDAGRKLAEKAKDAAQIFEQGKDSDKSDKKDESGQVKKAS
jgi:hypothetical protein